VERYARREMARKDRLFDAGIAVAVFAAAVGLLAVGEDGSLGALEVLVAAFASLPLVARRQAPLAVFVATGLASIVLSAIAEPAGPPLGPTLALYWLAASGEGSSSRAPLTLAIVATLLVGHVIAGGVHIEEILFGVLVWGGAWLAGDRTRMRGERMAELEERARRAEREAERERRLAAAEERGRIARDLHDSAGHAINVILVHAGMGRLQTERDPDRVREAFETIEEVARETVGEIDDMVGALREDATRPAEVEPPPGLAALEGLVERHRAAGVHVTAEVRGEWRPLPPPVDRGAYRILQEALTNAARHGSGDARVDLEFGARELEILVTNPVAAGGSGGGGHGVIGMRERAALLGGTLEAGADNGRFVMRARLPVDGDPA
jgi:signal transduction histidine kinase